MKDNYYSGQSYQAEVTKPVEYDTNGKPKPTAATVKIGPHLSDKAAFSFAQSHLNRCGFKVHRVSITN